MVHLYRAAWEAWKELAQEQFPTGIPAAVEALHSAGDLLSFHPHVHGLYLAGVTMPEGSFRSIEIDQERLQNLFADKVLSAAKSCSLRPPIPVASATHSSPIGRPKL